MDVKFPEDVHSFCSYSINYSLIIIDSVRLQSNEKRWGELLCIDSTHL